MQISLTFSWVHKSRKREIVFPEIRAIIFPHLFSHCFITISEYFLGSLEDTLSLLIIYRLVQSFWFVLRRNSKLLSLKSTLSARQPATPDDISDLWLLYQNISYIERSPAGDLGQDIFRIENCSRFLPIDMVYIACIFAWNSFINWLLSWTDDQ